MKRRRNHPILLIHFCIGGCLFYDPKGSVANLVILAHLNWQHLIWEMSPVRSSHRPPGEGRQILVGGKFF
jgi:hypothetical protein